MQKLIQWLGSRRVRGCVLALALLCSATGLTHAQSSAADNAGDPPSRVARLSYLSGDVGLLPSGTNDWSDADINRPLTTGDRLSSGRDARAELELGGTTVHIDHQTDVGVLDLNEQLAQIELTQGTLSLSVRHLDDGQSVEIDTPTVALVIDQVGSYRVDIDGDATRVTDFNGDATVYGENNARHDIRAGRRYDFLDSSLATVTISDIGDIGGGDNFDAWSNRRDRRYAQSRSRQYVSEDVVGYQDLDQYGQWQDSSDYGAVWYPDQVAADWAPYRDGHWAYIAPWGWSWVDASPWGYAPYHYGRWAYTHRGWGWIPGPRYVRPIYAPALVAFVGGGDWSVGIGSQPVGWYPLGPGEIYNPWYHCNRRYYTRVNVSNIRVTRNITNVTIISRVNNHYGHYRDNRPLRDERSIKPQRVRGFSAMPGREFAAGQRAQAHLIKVDQRKLASARVMPHGVGLPPARADHAQPRNARVNRLPTDGFRRRVVALHAPPIHAERRIEATNNRVAPRVGTVSSHVRLLNPREGSVGNKASGRGERSPLPRTSNVIPNAPVVQRRNAPGERSTQQAFPSERFAHPQGHNTAGDNRRPRSETSNVIPNAPVVQRRNAPSERTPQRGFPSERFAHPQGRNTAGDNRPPRSATSNVIPNAPIVQRRNAPSENSPQQVFQSERFAHPQARNTAGDNRSPLRGASNVISDAPVVQQNRPQTYVQRPQPTPRAVIYNQDRPQVRRGPPRSSMRESRQASPPPAAARRAEAPPTQRHSEAKPERAHEPRDHRDEQRQ